MSEDANVVESQEASEPVSEVSDQSASQPTESGSENQEQVQTEAVKPPSRESQPAPMIPKWRFDELNSRMQAAEASLREMRRPVEQAPKRPAAPNIEDFSTYEEYVRADAAFVAEQKVEAKFNEYVENQRQYQQQQAERQRQANFESNWKAKADEAMAKYPDFEDRLMSSKSIANQYTLEALKSSEIAGDLAYHIASDQKLVDKLNSMHPIQAAIEIGRLESKLKGESRNPVISKKPAAGVPAISPVKGGGQASRKGDSLTTDDIIARLYPR
jgi:hypothetical protein